MLPEKLQPYFNDPGMLLGIVLPFIGKLLTALAIFIIGRWVIKRFLRVIDKMMVLRNVDATLRDFFNAVLSVTLTFIVAVAALAEIGVNITSLLAVLGAAGLAVGLALQSSLSNFAAGIMLILFRPFKSGDYVEAGGVEGIVETISIFSTTYRTGDNKTIIVPNNLIYTDSIINYTQREHRRVDLVVGISYSDNIKQARDLVVSILERDPRIMKDPAPVVAVGELGESSVNILVRPWVRTDDYWDVYWELLETIKETFDEHKITIPFPQREINFHQPEALALASNNA